MSNITMKQHYVPAFYLRAWRVPGKEFASHLYREIEIDEQKNV
ncbi:MAG: hypothetical protein ACLPVO_08875 [Desulfomonilaceae bacterium]